MSSYDKIRNITLGPLDYGLNNITIEAYSAPFEEETAKIVYSFVVSYASPDEHLRLVGKKNQPASYHVRLRRSHRWTGLPK